MGYYLMFFISAAKPLPSAVTCQQPLLWTVEIASTLINTTVLMVMICREKWKSEGINLAGLVMPFEISVAGPCR